MYGSPVYFIIENISFANLFFFMPMGNDPDGRPDETISCAELVFQVAHIGEMEQLWIVDMQDKGRRIHPDLGTIIDLQLASGVGRGGVGVLGIP